MAQWMEALAALPKLCGSWHLQEAAAAIPIGANVRLRLVRLLHLTRLFMKRNLSGV